MVKQRLRKRPTTAPGGHYGLRSLLCAVPHARAPEAIVLGREHRLACVSKGFVELFRSVLPRTPRGRDRATGLVGQACWELAEETSALLRREFDLALTSGRPMVTREHLVRGSTGDGAERYFRFRLEPCSNERGKVVGLVTSPIDATQQVAAQQRLTAAEAERSELATAIDEAHQHRDKFLAVLGHELRHPLAPILSSLALLRLHDSSEWREERLVIERQVRVLRMLIDDLTETSRVSSGQLSMHWEFLSLEDAVIPAVESVLPLVRERAQTLTKHVAEDTPRVFGDALRLTQVITNLLVNAARYTPRGGSIHLEVQGESDAVVLTVRDTGIGIPPHMLDRIFELFVQGPGTSGPGGERQGLGLGLHLAQQLTALHRGTLRAFSEGPGHGSAFELRLPAAQRSSPHESHDHPGQDSEAQASRSFRRYEARRILVVEDDQDAAQLAAEVLGSAGHRVALAHDGASALRIVRSQDPDALVIDLGLPDMEGEALAHRVRSLGSTAQLVALSGQRLGRAAGRDGSPFEYHFLKPVELVELLRVFAKPPNRQSGSQS